MSPIDPATLTLLVFATWLALAVAAHRLFVRFRTRYPEVAKRDIPYAFTAAQHPEKFVYFFRRSSQRRLLGDPELARLRRRVRILSAMAIAVPFGGAAILLVAVVMARLSSCR